MPIPLSVTESFQCFHLVGDVVAGRVKHAQIRPQRDGLKCEVAPAMDRCLEVDIGKKRCVAENAATKVLHRRRRRQGSGDPNPESSFPRLRG